MESVKVQPIDPIAFVESQTDKVADKVWIKKYLHLSLKSQFNDSITFALMQHLDLYKYVDQEFFVDAIQFIQ